VGGVIAGAFAADAVLDFAQSALSEADRVGDATTRLEEQLGGLSEPIIAASDEFTKLGASEGDILELTARVADLGTAAGVSDDQLGPMALSAAETASALALLGDADAATIIDQIGKAAGGSDRPLKELGVNLTDAEVEARALADTGKLTADSLTEGELAAARFSLILEKLAPRVKTITDGEADLEQQQSQLQAKFETLTGKIGQGLEGPLNDLLSWILNGIVGWEMLGAKVGEFQQDIEEMTGPLRGAIDLLRTFVQLVGGGQFTGASQQFGFDVGRQIFGQQGSGAPVVVQVQGGSPEVVEQAVRNAVSTINGRIGR
jgi:hypothetical protein